MGDFFRLADLAVSIVNGMLFGLRQGFELSFSAIVWRCVGLSCLCFDQVGLAFTQIDS